MRLKKPDKKKRLFNPNLAGGAIWDGGCYPLSLVRLIISNLNEKKFIKPKIKQIKKLGELTKYADKLFPFAQDEKMIVDEKAKQVSTIGSNGDYTAPIIVHSHVALKVLVQLKNIELYFKMLDDESKRETALRLLQHYHSEKVATGLISKLATSQDKELNKLIMTALFRLYNREVEWFGKSWRSTRPNHKGPYFKPSKWAQTANIKKAIEKTNNKIIQAYLWNQKGNNNGGYLPSCTGNGA